MTLSAAFFSHCKVVLDIEVCDCDPFSLPGNFFEKHRGDFILQLHFDVEASKILSPHSKSSGVSSLAVVAQKLADVADERLRPLSLETAVQ